jgi:predicted Zn-dependent protease
VKRLQIISIGELDGVVLEGMAVELANHFGIPCEVLPQVIDSTFSFHGERRQYHSSKLLGELQQFAGSNTWRILGVAGVDLYIPILTFVFAKRRWVGRRCCFLLSLAPGVAWQPMATCCAGGC